MANCTMCTKFGECPWQTNPDSYCSAYEQKRLTNADSIRSMTDEELADWLGIYCNGQTAQEEGKPCTSGMGSCEECWLDWLKQEVTDND